MNSSKLGLKNIMLGWTASIVLCGIGGGMSASAIAAAAQQQSTPVVAPADSAR